MKKLSFLAVAFTAMIFAACGGNKGGQTTGAEADTVKSFEQEQIEASIKMQFDSLASEIGRLDKLPFLKDGADGIQLTEQEKQVKPDYLLDPATAENATTLAEKYRMLSALGVDKRIAMLYDMPVDDYEAALTKLLADINDPSFKEIQDAGSIYETTQTLYDAMQQNGRINYFWQLAAASVIEELTAMTQNSDKFLSVFNDDAAANVTFRIILLQDALERLTEYDPELAPVAEAIKPLTVLNATTVDELKSQLGEAKEQIAAARSALVK